MHVTSYPAGTRVQQHVCAFAARWCFSVQCMRRCLSLPLYNDTIPNDSLVMLFCEAWSLGSHDEESEAGRRPYSRAAHSSRRSRCWRAKNQHGTCIHAVVAGVHGTSSGASTYTVWPHAVCVYVLQERVATSEQPASQPTGRRCVLSTACGMPGCLGARVPVCHDRLSPHTPGISNTARQQPAGSLSRRSAYPGACYSLAARVEWHPPLACW